MLEIPSKFEFLFDNIARTLIMDSGRSSGKTTTVEEAAVLFMTQSRFNNIWYCRAEKSDLRKTCFSSMWATIQTLDLENLFSFSLSPLRIYCKSGAVCYFDGINGQVEDDLNATKGFTPQYRSLKMFIVDELNEVKCPAHITAAETTANKFLIEGSKIAFMYNPPPNKQHYIHAWSTEKKRIGADRIYTTWEDIRNFLKPATIAEIEKMRDTDPLFYRYWYLGEVVNFSGMVYPQFNRNKHLLSFYKLLACGDRPSELILGLDEGTVNDSTCVTALCVMTSGKSIVLDLYEYSPTDRASNQSESGSLSPSEQSRRIFKWLQNLLQKFPQIYGIPRTWIFESAEGGQMLRAQFIEDYGENTCLVEKKSIWGDVKRVRNMLSEEILFFHTAPNVNTHILVEDIENYVIDSKTNDIKKNQREDSIDSLEYATKLYFDNPIQRSIYGQ